MPGKREYEYCLTDTTLVGKLKLGGECDQGVDISDTEGGGLAEDVQKDQEPIKTLKPKLLKKARALKGNCSFFQ